MSKNQQYIQYGSGFSAPSEWRNFDASPTLRFERLHTKNATRFAEHAAFGDSWDNCLDVECKKPLENAQ